MRTCVHPDACAMHRVRVRVRVWLRLWDEGIWAAYVCDVDVRTHTLSHSLSEQNTLTHTLYYSLSEQNTLTHTLTQLSV